MVDIKIHTSSTKISKPERVLRYILFWCNEGMSDILIDEDLFQLKPNRALTITSGQFYQIKNIKGKLTALEFTLDFFCKNENDIELIFQNGLFCHFGENEIINIKEPLTVNNLLEKIEYELASRPYQYLISIHSYIELLLVELNRAKITNGDEIWKPDAIFLNFLEEVRTNFAGNYSVSHFAKKLGTTQAKLNELSKRHTAKTAQNVIYSLTVSEAKRLLMYTDLSVKEIAYRLGFNDQFYFSNFFKKHTSKSPMDYRKITAV